MMMFHYLCRSKCQTLIKNQQMCTNLIKCFKPIRSITTTDSSSSFTMSYLKNTCGLSGKSLTRASNGVNFKSPEKPDSVLEFFQTFGFSQTQVTKIISQFPKVLIYNAQETLKPKLDFLFSVVKSHDELISIIIRDPFILSRSLDHQLIPSFNLLSSSMGSQENAVAVIKCLPAIIRIDMSNCFLPNLTFLQTLGVPYSQISKMITEYGRPMAKRPDKFSKVVLRAKEMGFDPLSSSFIRAVTAMIYVKDSTWESKIGNCRNFGFSDDEILSMFKKQPLTMLLSVGKIKRQVEFFIKKLHWTPSMLSASPNILLYSLEKRIIPRCAVLQVLASRNMISSSRKLLMIVAMTEKIFFKNYVTKHEDEVPEVLDAYQGKLQFDDYTFHSR